MPADSPLSEITLRKYEKGTVVSRRELIRKMCLSLGLVQAGDARDAVVDVFDVLLSAKKALPSRHIMAQAALLREKAGLSTQGLTHANVCRMLRRLRQLYFVETNADAYRITERERLATLFREQTIPFYIQPLLDRITYVMEQVDALCNEKDAEVGKTHERSVEKKE